MTPLDYVAIAVGYFVMAVMGLLTFLAVAGGAWHVLKTGRFLRLRPEEARTRERASSPRVTGREFGERGRLSPPTPVLGSRPVTPIFDKYRTYTNWDEGA